MTSTPDKSRNLAAAHDLMLEARDRGAELVALPENFALLTDDSRQFLEEAETLKGITVESLREWAAEQDLWILGGSVALKTKTPGKLTNTSLLISPDGDIVARTTKSIFSMSNSQVIATITNPSISSRARRPSWSKRHWAVWAFRSAMT